MNNNLKTTAYEMRLDVLEMVFQSKAGHIGGSMSCMDILTTLYFSVMDTEKIKSNSPERDRFILSKGHCAEALYAVLAGAGIIPKEELCTFTAFGTKLAEHPTNKIQGVDFATGALGHGLSVGAGMAIGLKKSTSDAHVYILTGDGELSEGSIWEAAMSASKYGLDNLTWIIDRNRLQMSGDTEDIMPLGNLKEKLNAFGLKVLECDGHNFDELETALRTREKGFPVALIANTVKGKGSPVMENKTDWHHLIPNERQHDEIKRDILSEIGGA